MLFRRLIRWRPPRPIPIRLDDYHAADIGFTQDGRQFFVTDPFLSAINGSAGREFLAIYLFDAGGVFLDARIDDLGTRATLDAKQAAQLRATRIAELGPIERQTIRINPFEVNRFGVRFGLIEVPPSRIIFDWQVVLVPGDYMAFGPPWNGEYDT